LVCVSPEMLAQPRYDRRFVSYDLVLFVPH